MADKANIYTHRKSKRNTFVMIDKFNIEDPRLSWKAKGILHYILSKPDDWQIYERDIMKHATDGRDSVRTGIKELLKYGYMTRRKRRNEKGKFCGYHYETFEVPTEDVKSVHGTEGGKSVLGKSDDGKPATTNNDLTKNEKKQQQTTELPPMPAKVATNENIVVVSLASQKEKPEAIKPSSDKSVTAKVVTAEESYKEKPLTDFQEIGFQETGNQPLVINNLNDKKEEQQTPVLLLAASEPVVVSSASEEQENIDTNVTEQIEPANQPVEKLVTEEKQESILQLVEIGVSKNVAIELAQLKSAADIDLAVCYAKGKNTVQDKPAFIVTALRQDWTLATAKTKEKSVPAVTEQQEPLERWTGENVFSNLLHKMRAGRMKGADQAGIVC